MWHRNLSLTGAAMIKVVMSCFGLCCFLLSACTGIDYHRMFQAGSDAMGAATVTDGKVKELALQGVRHNDLTMQVEPENSKNTKRLRKIMEDFREVNGTPLNYKVYVDPSLNAAAYADGSIRVNSGLMDAMNDDEVRFVLGHEIGHVAHGHSLKAARLALATSAAKNAASSLNPTVAQISDLGAGDLARLLLHAQYDQSQELDADSYGINFLKSHNRNPNAAISAMRKLGASGGGFFESHPSNETRVNNLQALKDGADPSTLRTDK